MTLSGTTRATVLLLMPAVLALSVPCVASAQGDRSSSGAQARAPHDRLQPRTLPPLPAGMTIQTIVLGDSIYHGKGTCFACHGPEGEGLPAAGDALTISLNWAQYNWRSIDSLITAGIPQTITRSPIAMPPRGGRSDLTPEEVRRVAAYVWAISQTQGEPWPGGHTSHTAMIPAGSARGTASRMLIPRTPVPGGPNSTVHAPPGSKGKHSQ